METELIDEAVDKKLVEGAEVKVPLDGEAVTEKKPEEKPAETQKENHDSRRWRRLLQERAEFKAKAELYEKVMSEKQNHVEEPKKPTLEDFGGNTEQYVEALVEHKAKTLIPAVEKEPGKNVEAKIWKEKERAISKEIPDYEEVVYDSEPLNVPVGVINAILTSDVGANIRYMLAKNPEIADRISEMPEHSAIREIGKLEAKIEAEIAARPAPKKKSDAPAPIEPEKGSGVSAKIDTSKMSDQEWFEYEKKQKMEKFKTKGRF